ncbi:MAG: hypothetical protein ACD_71C00212G0003 [uncultured bacterium (gcode 4)]|uniref:Uncharacterized protein n=1 Tax=uncultured bacterium (gcode 4) TaxID=1234023 RepID=K1ZIG4_9BACT|nr:MAG: hypothetical protein ACD_71C00212G0003 [uncultured bacterium (gcode 4)]
MKKSHRKKEGNVLIQNTPPTYIENDQSSYTEKYLHPLVMSKAMLQTMYARKRDAYIYKKIHPADQEKTEADGWIVHREGSNTVRMKRLKSHDKLLEDQAWCLFYRMRYPELNGDNFVIRYERQDKTIGEKQIDVFAKDDETVIVAECKSKEIRGRRSLQKDLSETDALQKFIANAIRNQYGQDFKPKIIWLYITSNIIWSDPDIERANAINVRVITENEMQYFDSFIKHMGPAGRFQFLAEFLQGQDIPGLSNIKLPATRGTLGGQKFYSFLTTPRQLLKIAFVNHQALNHPDGRPAYQRMISSSRINEIGGFIKGGGYFPTNLLINFTEECRFELISNKENSDPNIKFGWLYLPNKYKSAWIIDGQHRLYGYSHLEGEFWDQNVAVIAFEKLDTITEAELFVTINHKQKKVEQSVIISLKSDLKWGSEDPKERLSALASRLVKTLNSDPTSPFFQRFSMQGVTSKENQSLTLPEVVKGLIASGLLGRQVHKLFATGPLSGPVDEKTIDRARRILNSYFSQIRDSHTQRWDTGRSSYISTNPGIRAHLKVLMDIIKYCEIKQDFDAQLEDEENLLKCALRIAKPILDFIINASDAEIFEEFGRKFGEGGVRDYIFNLCKIIHAEFSDFGSEDFLKRLVQESDNRRKQTHQDVIQLSQDILDYVFKILKERYGTSEEKSGEKTYWEKGIESPKIKTEAYNRQQADPPDKRGPREAYLHILDLMDIIRQKNNWLLFENVFNIPLPGEKGKTYYLDWMRMFNEIRRIPAHGSASRVYDEKDYEFMRHIKYEFYRRLNSALGIQEEL